MRRITLTLFCIILFWGSLLQSQSNDVSLIGTGGHVAKSGNIFLSYSFGEPISLFETNGNHWLTQGFQQPGKINTTATSDVSENVAIRITPNPAVNELIIHLAKEESCDKISVISLSGQRIVMGTEIKSEMIILDLKSLPAGTYWIEGECHQQRAFIKSFIKI